MLEIKELVVKAHDKTILDKFNLKIKPGEVHVLMGQNGTGKSTICKTILKHPDYKIVGGSCCYLGHDLSKLKTDEVSRLGVFLINQNPIEVEGITNAELLRNAISSKTKEKVDIFAFNKKLNEVCDIINLSKEFVHRDVNFNMSGGEKKKNELLQLFILEPNLIILDEIDSGLDVDALKTVGISLQKYYDMYKPAILIITHHYNILEYFKDFTVHILKNGRIVQTGDKNLALEIDKNGFEANVINEVLENE